MTKKKPKLHAEWFKARLKDVGLSQRAAAKKLGLNQSLISHMFIGRRRMSYLESHRWADLLRQDIHEVMSRAGLPIIRTSKNARALNARAEYRRGYKDCQRDLKKFLSKIS